MREVTVRFRIDDAARFALGDQWSDGQRATLAQVRRWIQTVVQTTLDDIVADYQAGRGEATGKEQ